MKLEEHPGSITIETPEGKICLASEEAFDLLSWLYNRRAWLFQSSQHDRQAQALANGQERRARDEQLSKISKHVAWVVLDTKQAIQRIESANGDPHEKRRRTDMAMVAMLEVVAPVLPGPVQVEVRRLIDLHNLAWRDPGAETQSGADGGFDEFRRQARMAAYHAGERTIEPTVKPLSQEQAIATWTELQRLISVGAYEERSAEHHETGTWPEDGVEESVANLETWAERQGLEFCFNHDSKTWSLAPIEIRSEDGV